MWLKSGKKRNTIYNRETPAGCKHRLVGDDMSNSRRGFVPSDAKEFSVDNLNILRIAQQDILYLLSRGYPIKNASTYVGNHYMLSERQRLAIVRASSEQNALMLRKAKELSKEQMKQKIYIDGLNTIITLEVALSEGTLIRCMDGTIRDLAGLRGTYRLIDKTEKAIVLIGAKLMELQIEHVTFYLDAPVSNTGRLKMKLYELLKEFPYGIDVQLVNNADVLLEKLENVITSDAIVLNRCKSWYNLVRDILKSNVPEVTYVDLS
jgi:hypothetical protein